MLHIKDIEAFAHINEALARDADTSRTGTRADDHRPAAHPALLLAMAATGRLKPEEPGTDHTSGRSTNHPASLAGMVARMFTRDRG